MEGNVSEVAEHSISIASYFQGHILLVVNTPGCNVMFYKKQWLFLLGKLFLVCRVNEIYQYLWCPSQMTIIFDSFTTEINWENKQEYKHVLNRMSKQFYQFCLVIAWCCIEAERLLMLQTNAQTIGTSVRATRSENVFLTYTVA